MNRFSTFAFLCALTFSLVACGSKGVGDPCIPESVPSDGYSKKEIYLETSGVQCKTRACLVYQLGGGAGNANEFGNPLDICERDDTDGAGDPNRCVTVDALNKHVFCSCRCGAPQGANTPLCACPDQFACKEDVVTTGGVGSIGSYCVRCDLLSTTEQARYESCKKK